jgi:hypothetical protein
MLKFSLKLTHPILDFILSIEIWILTSKIEIQNNFLIFLVRQNVLNPMVSSEAGAAPFIFLEPEPHQIVKIFEFYTK